MELKLFVEGIADRKFLKDFISLKYNVLLTDNQIIETGGWTKIHSDGYDGEMIRNQMTQNSDNGGTNILIFDADSDYKKRFRDIKEWKQSMSLDFDVFLWPNNSDKGDLETMLEKIINPINSPIFDCWEDYERCLLTKNIENRDIPLTIPARKTKIYGYLEALLGESKSQKKKIKEANRDY